MKLELKEYQESNKSYRNNVRFLVLRVQNKRVTSLPFTEHLMLVTVRYCLLFADLKVESFFGNILRVLI